MLRRRLADWEIPVDFLRAIVNDSKKYSLIILVNGHGQVGKTTFIWHLANRIEQIKKYGRLKATDPRNTWKEWDAKGKTATNAQDFVKIWNNNSNGVMTLVEASTTLYYLNWMDVMAEVFNSTTTTQGLKHNICFLDTVMASEIMKKAKDKVDFRVWVYKRFDSMKMSKIRSGWVKLDHLRDTSKLIPYNTWDCYYSARELMLCKQYTDWVASTMKKKEALKNEARVGLRYNSQKRMSLKNCPAWVKDLI